MNEETAVWTALPNGLTADGAMARVSIMVAPRLTADGGQQPLGVYKAFADWPGTLDEVQLGLALHGGPSFDKVEADPSAPRPDSSLWKAMFSETCAVRTRTFTDLSARPIRSFPADEVVEHVRVLYATVASSAATDFPVRQDLESYIGRDIAGISRGPSDAYGRLQALFVTNPGVPPHIDRSTPAYVSHRKRWAFTQAYRFYDRPKTRDAYQARPDPALPVPPRPSRPSVDFHACCTFLGDYPELLRRLGLVIDVVVPIANLPAAGRIRVLAEHANHPWMAHEGRRPWTRFLFGAGRFETEPRQDSDLLNRMLHLGLGPARWLVTDVDLDGSGMKYVDLAQTVAKLGETRFANSDDPPGASVPALRSGGITVTRKDRAKQITGSIVQGKTNEQSTGGNTPAELWAEDVTRGYRVDVGVVVGGKVAAWRSLCRRTGDYVIRRPSGDVKVDVTPDEGYVKSSSATSVPQGDPDLYLHEALFGWDGWSLVAPRPGKTIGLDETPEVPHPHVDPDFPLDVAFRPVPGSLPSLRYGRTYKLRARAVDLAANSLPFDAEIADALAGPDITYRRWEPVVPPVFVPRRPFNEGESLHRLVVRSTFQLSPAQYVALDRVRDLPGHGTSSGADGLDRSYRDYDERHVAAPKTAQQMAEQHGMFDPAMGQQDPAVYQSAYLTAAREAGTFLDLQVPDPENPLGLVDISASVHVVNHNPEVAPVTALPVPRGAGLDTGEYVVHDSDKLLLPYLPDVLARGVSFRGLPGAAPNHLVAFEGAWPDATPFRLRLEGGDHPPEPGDRLLTVFLPPAEVARVRVSCHLKVEDLPLLAVWALLPDATKAQLQQAAVNGEHWMLTPWIDVVLVHAVEKPLAPALFVDIEPDRLVGETFAALQDQMSVHAKSTGRVDVEASWEEPLDDVTRPAPHTVQGVAHVADFRLEPSEDEPAIGRTDSPGPLHPEMHQVRHEFGDTKHRLVSYTPVATTRFREYFPPAVTEDRTLITHSGPSHDVHIPSSRRPEPPDVLYTVPTFRWAEQASAGSISRTRHGEGLRIYLRRPWYSSGDDELLALVLPNQSAPPAGAAHGNIASAAASLAGRYVSRWGVDPVWNRSLRIPGPAIQNFPNRVGWRTGLTLAEVTGPLVAVAAFKPEFDDGRRLWYCDVDIDFGVAANGAPYFPFLRLALARFQPFSVPGQELSKVVLNDFIQVAPDRTTTLKGAGNQLMRVDVEGPGAFNELGRRFGDGDVAMERSREVIAYVQRAPKGSTSGLEWVTLGSNKVLDARKTAEGADFWTGVVPLPPADAQSMYRLAVEERELYETDDSEAERPPANLPNVAVRRRPIYADHFALRVGPGNVLTL